VLGDKLSITLFVTRNKNLQPCPYVIHIFNKKEELAINDLTKYKQETLHFGQVGL
jgi:hypothetical protein